MSDEQSRTAEIVDPRYLIDALISLQIGIRKLSLYSASHAVIPDIVINLGKQFNALFEFVETVSLGVAKEEILYHGTPITKDNPVIRTLARMLHQLNLISVTFRKGLTGDEILQFLRVIAESRPLSLPEREVMISQFNEETLSITLQLISFQGAVKGRGDPDPCAQGQEGESGGRERMLWHGLVNRLMKDEIPEEARQALNRASGDTIDPAQLAGAINALCQRSHTTPQSYEHVIVDYLREQTRHQAVSKERRMQITKELGTLLSNLHPDVRKQIFRTSLETTDEKVPLEDLIDVIPPSMLIEVLNQIQLSSQSVSVSMFSLLKKLVGLSGSDDGLQNVLEEKLQDHKGLFEELFVERSDKTFYPSSYGSLLHEDFTADSLSRRASSETEGLDPAETNHHLSLILLEFLEGPATPEEQYEGFVDYMNRLLVEGMGEHTQAVLTETLQVLLQKHQSVPEEHRGLFERQIRKFLKPGILTHLTQVHHQDQDAGENTILTQLQDVVGPEIIPVLLDLLETEGRLSARKRLLEILTRCGAGVIPEAMHRLKSPNWYIVRNMLVLLRNLRAREAIPQIADCMQRKSPKIRLAALQALGEIGPDTDHLFQALAFSLKDGDPKIFKAAVSLLVSSHDGRALEMIAAQFEGADQESELRERHLAILDAIAHSGTKDWMPMLLARRKRWVLRFWRWGRQQALVKALNHAILEIRLREKRSHG